MKCNTEH